MSSGIGGSKMRFSGERQTVQSLRLRNVCASRVRVRTARVRNLFAYDTRFIIFW